MSQPPPPLPDGPIPITQAITLALHYCNFGHLALCDTVCDRILSVDANHVQALVIRGISAYRGRDNGTAVALLAKAARLSPDFADAHHHLGQALLYAGDAAAAGRSFARATALRPDYAEAMAGLGEAWRALGEGDAAFGVLGRALWLRPNYSPPYVTHSLMRFERSLPAGSLPWTARRPATAGRPRLTIASLASYGRFAHTVQEYVAVRLYAERYGLDFATPDWVGHAFFELDDPLMDGALQPQFAEWRSVREEFARGFAERVVEPYAGRDLFLGGSPVDVWQAGFRDRVLGWLRPRACWTPFLEPAIVHLRGLGRTLVAFHIRQTDWWDKAYTPLSLYLDWLDAHWQGLDHPVLFICTDEPKVVPEFARYRPLTLDRLPNSWPGLDYLLDFHVLMNADVVGISTGAFGRMAAALNRGAGTRFLRPDAANMALEPFAPWSPA